VLINSTGQGTLGWAAQHFEDTVKLTVDSGITIARPMHGIPVRCYGQTITACERYLATMGRGATDQTELSRNVVAESPFLLPPWPVGSAFDAMEAALTGTMQNLTHQGSLLADAR